MQRATHEPSSCISSFFKALRLLGRNFSSGIDRTMTTASMVHLAYLQKDVTSVQTHKVLRNVENELYSVDLEEANGSLDDPDAKSGPGLAMQNASCLQLLAGC